MLSFKKVTLLLFLLLERSRQETNQPLVDCQSKNNIIFNLNETVISIDCSQSNYDLVESDIKCAHNKNKAEYGKKYELAEVSTFEITGCSLHSKLTIETILHLLEVSLKHIKSIRIVCNKSPLSSTQLTGLQLVTHLYIEDYQSSVNLETLTVLPHLKELTINCVFLQKVSNKTIFEELENLHIDLHENYLTELGTQNILRDLMSMSGKFKILKFYYHNIGFYGLRRMVLEEKSFGNNKGLEVFEVTQRVERVEKCAFDNLQNLRQLRISDGEITTIHSETFPSSLEIIDLSHNRLTSFIDGTHLINLVELRLSSNQIETFYEKTLPSSLKSLDLSYNELTSFIGRNNLTNLEKLSLNDNQIITFDTKTLPSSLKFLDLSHNQLTSFIEGTHLKKLEELRLNLNQLEIFDTKTMPSSLKILDLSHNRLTYFIDGTHLINLVELELSSNLIDTFDAETLPSSLKILDLFLNRLTSFVGGSNLTNLEKLSLRDNQIETLDVNTLPSSLKFLDLSHNRLTSFIQGAHLINLEELRVENNLIDTFDAKTLLSSLKILDLSFNRLTSFIEGTHLTNLEKLSRKDNQIVAFDIKTLPSSLKILNLSYNNLTSFIEGINLTNLEVLYLHGNQILKLALNLEELPKLQRISLSDNHLKWLHVFGSWTSSLEEVDLSNNDIQNLDAWQWIDQHKLNVYHGETYPECDCNWPKSDSKLIEKLAKFCRPPIAERFLIELSELDCRSEKRDSCITYKSKNGKIMFNCSNTHWLGANDTFSKNLLFDIQYLKSIYISLSGNKDIHFLPKIPQSTNRELEVFIYAENCEIADPFLVDDLKNRDDIKKLYLANNTIAYIDVSDLQILEKMGTKLTLSGNPFRCDCDHQLMYNTIMQMRHLIEDYDQMTCDDRSSFVPNRILCFQWQTFFLSFAVVVFVIISGLAIFYIFFSLEIKIFIYSRGWFPAMFRPDSDGQTYVYDVFVSYSDWDEDFVYSIIDYLEHGISPPLKVCFHNRDWIGGDRIDRQIINSVEASRKTLIIFSRNFLTSYWGSLEFRTAFLTMLHEKTSKLVLIIYGDIGPLDELKPEIRSYIKTTTYLASDNKWFWKRLAYALRRPKDVQMEIVEENNEQTGELAL